MLPERSPPNRVSVAALSLLSWVHNAPTASDRKLWSDSKIVLLLEPRSPVDLDKLLGSEVDACIPLSVSAVTLISTLDLIMATDARVLIVSDMTDLPIPSSHR